MALQTGNPFLDVLGGDKWGINTFDVFFTDGTGGPWVTQEQEDFVQALNAWSAVANVHFRVTTNRAEAEFVEHREVASYYDNDGDPDTSGTDTEGTHAMPTSGRTSGALFGHYNISVWTSFGTLDQGGAVFETFLHEIGHALGLNHPHADGDPYGSLFPNSSLDDTLYTVMSYKDDAADQGVHNLYSNIGSPMALDIAAIQLMYGANLHYNDGDSVYYLPTADGPGTMYSCIWDTSGIDTIAYTGSDNAKIDLRAAWLGDGVGGGGFLSSVDGIFGGFTIAADATNVLGDLNGETGVIIEYATGGSGNDEINGNRVGNRLLGGAGNDVVLGWEGDDWIAGGSGNDRLYGGAENDRLYGGGDNDTLVGDAGRDFLYGEAGDDTLYGGDHLIADGTRDDMYGGAGNDSYHVTDTIDFVHELTGGADMADRVFTTLNSFSIRQSARVEGDIEQLIFVGQGNFVGTGNDLNNALVGGAGNDTLYGNGGHDWIDGLGGSDTMHGGTGDDTYVTDNNRDRVIDLVGPDGGIDTIRTTKAFQHLTTSATLTGDIENIEFVGDSQHFSRGNALENRMTGAGSTDRLYGEGGRDTLIGNGGVDFLYGGAGNDTLEGGAGNDTLEGGADIDTLHGGDNRDTLNGGAGNDTMYGGGGEDTFLVNGVVQDIQGDVVYGGVIGGDTSTDTIDFTGLTAGRVRVDLAAGLVQATAGAVTAAMGYVEGIERVVGGGDADVLLGDNRFNTLEGGAGADTLDGRGGVDILRGGSGGDTFVMSGNWGRDAIMDFERGADLIDLRDIPGISFANLVFTDTPDGTRFVIAGDTLGRFVGIAGLKKADMSAADFWFAGQPDPRAPIVGTEGADMLTGNGFANTIDGLGGDDVLNGRGQADMLRGGAGNDRLVLDGDFPQSGMDTFDGGADTDTLDASQFAGYVQVDLATGSLGLTSADGNSWAAANGKVIGIENVIGTARADTITGGSSRGNFLGGGGDDTLVGGSQFDWMEGGAGNDVIRGTTGATVMFGGEGNDTMTASADAASSMYGGIGNDVMRGSSQADYMSDQDGGDDSMHGGEGNDTLVDYAGTNYLYGEGGDDFITSVGSGGTLDGGAGNDRVTGGQSTDTLVGGIGNDQLDGGGGGADSLDGGAGDDYMYVSQGFASAHGGTGHDYLLADSSFTGDTFNFRIGTTGIEHVGTQGGNDTVDARGVATAVTFAAGAGNDTFYGSYASDTFWAGEGMDTFVLAGNRADYDVMHFADTTIRITDRLTGALDQVVDVETFRFADQSVSSSDFIV